MKRITLLIGLVTASVLSFAQSTAIGQDAKDSNPITTAVPFLTIATDSRAGAMGDIGVATSADINSIKYNVAKYPFAENAYGVSVSYTPWLKKLVNDINLLYLSGYMKFGDKQVVSGALTYFSLGNIQFLDDYGSFVKDYTPNEFTIRGGYSRLLTDHLSLGLTLGYVYSNLTGGYSNSSSEVTYGYAFASDIGIFYNNTTEVSGRDVNYALGFSISDIGNKMSYSNGAEKNFLPTNMKLGAAVTLQLDEYNSIMGSFEVSKLLVPTPPIYYKEGDIDANGDTVKTNGKFIKYGKDPNSVSVAGGMFQSFSDAPGIVDGNSRSVFKEEIKEIIWAFGLEYWYAKQFALRAGYFHEAAMKGNRKFWSLGLGLRYNAFGLDFAYLLPSNGQNSPLANTLRFTLSFDFAAVNNQK